MRKYRANFTREKRIYCGNDYLEVDIIPVSIAQIKKGRGKKRKVSAPKQKNLNEKNAKRYFVQLLNSNFGLGDLHLTFTYDTKCLPPTIQEAEREAKNFMRRIAHKMKQAEVELKYILVTEYTTDEAEEPIRVHHHAFINGGLDRDMIESLWRKRKKKGEKEGQKIGFINADRLQPNENGLEGLGKYLQKISGRKKRWSSSHNLKKPYQQTDDERYTRRQVEKLAKQPPDAAYWEKQYKGYQFVSYEAKYNDMTGWAIYLKMCRRGTST